MNNIVYNSPRDFIGDSLITLAKKDPDIVVVDADLASSVTTDRFQKAFPERFFEMGIAEQSCMGVAAGLAAEGLTPFFASMAMFTVGTAWTQLRQACYANLNIKVIGSHAGVDDGPDGASHHALEDLAMTRTIPNLIVMTPCDAHELFAAIEQAAAIKGPVYIRVPRDNMPLLHPVGCSFPIGSAE
ncbi:MAG: transketolase family protein, partial [Lachnoclostridium sp.]|nr:transketolase family protein [Lachnoclostridium sp.]